MNAETIAPGHPQWHSYVEGPLRVADAEAVEWFDSADVVVVGFGAAGVSTALEARAAQVDVLAIDRFHGGGASAVSGGVVYSGGGTPFQREAGFDDTPEEMFKYLQIETQGIVRDSTLRRFCNNSRANLEWLMSHGVRFAGTLHKEKTVYPPEGKFLYYAGNELLQGNQSVARPAPRGHRAVGKGIFCGAYLFGPLQTSALKKGVRLMTHSPVTRLVIDRAGRVVGVEVRRLPPDSPAWKEHDKASHRVQAFLRLIPPAVIKLGKKLENLEATAGERTLIRARRGVVLSAGGFIFNREMVTHYAPRYLGGIPTGSTGCDGSGIRLGQSAGGVAKRMDSVSATRVISPPLAFVHGIVVDDHGRRFVEEDAYAGSMGRKIAEHASKRTFLIIDKTTRRAALKFCSPFGERWVLDRAPVLRTLLFNCRKGRDATDLAKRIGIDPATLERTIRDYNDNARRGEDPLGKNAHYLHVLEGPLWAIDISTDNTTLIYSIITMGGLAIDEDTGHVIREDGTHIPGLYAAGRTAIGIPSNFYVSGTSLADCVFSGRRAGAHAAANTNDDQASVMSTA